MQLPFSFARPVLLWLLLLLPVLVVLAYRMGKRRRALLAGRGVESEALADPATRRDAWG